jgi:hypothetical protein
VNKGKNNNITGNGNSINGSNNIIGTQKEKVDGDSHTILKGSFSQLVR